MGDNFNENLKNARERKGMSQKDVAEEIGVAKSTYSLYESGNREPNVQTIKKIADVLNDVNVLVNARVEVQRAIDYGIDKKVLNEILELQYKHRFLKISDV